MKILFVGDVVGKPGRRAVRRWVPEIRANEGVDLVIVNAENAAGGLGATPATLRELRESGADAFTMGNHTWRKKDVIPELEEAGDIIRPANYPEGVPGHGSMILTRPDGVKVAVVNLIGRIYMEPFECPFLKVEAMLPGLKKQADLILVDMHAEATSEKVAMGWALDGHVAAVVGTHTHVQTADEWILPGGTAYITDIGMCGPLYSVIGTERAPVLKRFRTGMPNMFSVAKSGPAVFAAVLIEADPRTGKATAIRRYLLREEDDAGSTQ
jgi:hypothetical protein